jgi:hypothetical protein
MGAAVPERRRGSFSRGGPLRAGRRPRIHFAPPAGIPGRHRPVTDSWNFVNRVRDVARADPDRRALIFPKTKPGVSPINYNTITFKKLNKKKLIKKIKKKILKISKNFLKK